MDRIVSVAVGRQNTGDLSGEPGDDGTLSVSKENLTPCSAKSSSSDREGVATKRRRCCGRHCRDSWGEGSVVVEASSGHGHGVESHGDLRGSPLPPATSDGGRGDALELVVGRCDHLALGAGDGHGAAGPGVNGGREAGAGNSDCGSSAKRSLGRAVAEDLHRDRVGERPSSGKTKTLDHH